MADVNHLRQKPELYFIHTSHYDWLLSRIYVLFEEFLWRNLLM